jgi:membrane protease YdiL (CAAX protease family)
MLAITTLVVSAVIECAFLIAPLYYAARTRPPGAPLSAGLRALGFRRAPLGISAALVVGGVIVTLAVSLLYGLIVELFRLDLKTNAQALQDQAASMPLTVLATLIVAVFVAPFCEEIFFRGYLFSGLLRGMSLWPAVVLSAVLFTLSHGDVGSAAPILVLGLLLALVRWRTGSIWPGMALHMANNLLAAAVIIATLLHP